MTSIGTYAQQKIHQRRRYFSRLLDVLGKYMFKLISRSKLFPSETMDIQNNNGKREGSQLTHCSWYSKQKERSPKQKGVSYIVPRL